MWFVFECDFEFECESVMAAADFDPSEYVDPTEPEGLPDGAPVLEVAESPTTSVQVPEPAALLAGELLEAYGRNADGASSAALARAIWAVGANLFLRIPGENFPRPEPLTRDGKPSNEHERDKARFCMKHPHVAVGDLAAVDDHVDTLLEIVRLIAENNVDVDDE